MRFSAAVAIFTAAMTTGQMAASEDAPAEWVAFGSNYRATMTLAADQQLFCGHYLLGQPTVEVVCENGSASLSIDTGPCSIGPIYNLNMDTGGDRSVMSDRMSVKLDELSIGDLIKSEWLLVVVPPSGELIDFEQALLFDFRAFPLSAYRYRDLCGL